MNLKYHQGWRELNSKKKRDWIKVLDVVATCIMLFAVFFLLLDRAW